MWAAFDVGYRCGIGLDELPIGLHRVYVGFSTTPLKQSSIFLINRGCFGELFWEA